MFTDDSASEYFSTASNIDAEFLSTTSSIASAPLSPLLSLLRYTSFSSTSDYLYASNPPTRRFPPPFISLYSLSNISVKAGGLSTPISPVEIIVPNADSKTFIEDFSMLGRMHGVGPPPSRLGS